MQKDLLRYLALLAKDYPSIQAASAAIIKLTAQLNLPKGTEHFLSDIHGEDEAFRHALRTGSGSIRQKIEEIFAETLSDREKSELATLIYYPEEKLPLIRENIADDAHWSHKTLSRLLQICQVVASKYPLAQVDALLPTPLATIIEELLLTQETNENKRHYYQSTLASIVETGAADPFITALAHLIQRLTIARLHIIGDIYDRGSGAHLIMDALMDYRNVDIQWGNHDIVWMGAAAGSDACIANVVRVCLRYANMETLENGYAVSLLPLASLAIDIYGSDPCQQFLPPPATELELTDHERRLMAQMHKAITIIQLKLEGQIIRRCPHFEMKDRLLLDKIDFENGTVRIADTDYPLIDTYFPTIDPKRPFLLTNQEKIVVDKLRLSFINSAKLQKHVRFLFSRGGMYLIYNGNLLYHGCIPMNEDGSFKAFKLDDQALATKAFMDRADRLARQGYFVSNDPAQKLYGMDAMWYLWSGAQSPLFGKEKMATFERYFIADKTTHSEKRNPYYTFRDQEETARKILQAFDMDAETGHIINGHVPVKVKKGENPIKANGKLIVIDGGFSRAYQKQTGIAGYTLVYNSYEIRLVAHAPFESTQKAVEEELDANPHTETLEVCPVRQRVKDTALGCDILQQIDELNTLLQAYRAGSLKER